MFFTRNNYGEINGAVRSHRVWSIVAVALLFTVLGSFYTVNPGEVAITKTLGKLNSSIEQAGLHWKTPRIDTVIKFDVQTIKDDTTATAASKDLQNVTTDVVINYNVDPSKAMSIYTTLGTIDDVRSKVVTPSIQEVVKAVTSKYTAEELITKRSSVGADIIAGMKEKLGRFGLLVTDINIVNFKFSDGFDQAIEAKVRAEQDALAQKNKLEQVKYEAEQTVVKATAEANSIKIQAEAVRQQGGAEYVQLQWIAKWDGKLPTTQLGANNNTMMMLK